MSALRQLILKENIVKMITIYLEDGTSLKFLNVIQINLYGGSQQINFRHKSNGETLETCFNKEKIAGYTISQELT